MELTKEEALFIPEVQLFCYPSYYFFAIRYQFPSSK